MFQARSVVAGHEWAEAVTDPYIDGSGKEYQTAWASKKGEVGDLCEPDRRSKFNIANVFTLKLKTGKFAMQKPWSDAANRCVASS